MESTMIEVVVALEEHLLRLGTKAALDEAEDCCCVARPVT